MSIQRQAKLSTFCTGFEGARLSTYWLKRMRRLRLPHLCSGCWLQLWPAGTAALSEALLKAIKQTASSMRYALPMKDTHPPSTLSWTTS